MTTYYNLPVYKQSYDLLLDIFKLTKEFNREYKYTIGELIGSGGAGGASYYDGYGSGNPGAALPSGGAGGTGTTRINQSNF